jgi:hypothetical protein
MDKPIKVIRIITIEKFRQALKGIGYSLKWRGCTDWEIIDYKGHSTNIRFQCTSQHSQENWDDTYLPILRIECFEANFVGRVDINVNTIKIFKNRLELTTLDPQTGISLYNHDIKN